MEGIIFIGVQASGKSTFYKQKFFNSHLRISLDLLNTRNKEQQFLDKCMELQQRVVIDNTNPTKEERQKYIAKLKSNNYKVTGYYFQSKVKDCVLRNSKRIGKEKVPEASIYATHSKLELPVLKEGFDTIYYVEIVNNEFKIAAWNNEI